MKSIIGAALLGTFLSLALNAHAGEKLNAITFSGNISSTETEGQTNDMSQINIGYERMFTPQVTLGVRFSLFEASSTTSTYVYFEPKYYFATPGTPGNTVVYLKGSLGSFSSSGDNYDASGMGYGGFIGLEHAVTESASIFGEIGVTSFKLDAGDNTVTQDGNEIFFGMKYSF